MYTQTPAQPKHLSSGQTQADLDFFWNSIPDDFIIQENDEQSSVINPSFSDPSNSTNINLNLGSGLESHHQNSNHQSQSQFQVSHVHHSHSMVQPDLENLAAFGALPDSQYGMQDDSFVFPNSQLSHSHDTISLSTITAPPLSTHTHRSDTDTLTPKSPWPRKLSSILSFSEFGSAPDLLSLFPTSKAQAGPAPSIFRPDSPTLPYYVPEEHSSKQEKAILDVKDIPSSCSDTFTSSSSVTEIAPNDHIVASTMPLPALHSVPDLIFPSSDASSSAESTPAHSRKNSCKDQAESQEGTSKSYLSNLMDNFSTSSQAMPHPLCLPPSRRKSVVTQTLHKPTNPTMKERRRRSSAKMTALVQFQDQENSYIKQESIGLNHQSLMDIDSDGQADSSSFDIDRSNSMLDQSEACGSSLELDLASKERTPHTEVERKYRHGINYGISLLGNSVPKLRYQIDAYNSEQRQLRARRGRAQVTFTDPSNYNNPTLSNGDLDTSPLYHSPEDITTISSGGVSDNCFPESNEGSSSGQSSTDSSSPQNTTTKQPNPKCKYKYPSKLAIIQGAAEYIQRLEINHEKLRREYAALQAMAMNGLVVGVRAHPTETEVGAPGPVGAHNQHFAAMGMSSGAIQQGVACMWPNNGAIPTQPIL